MLRYLFFATLLLSCHSVKVNQEPIATFFGNVVLLDEDPLCKFRQSKTYEDRLEDIFRNTMWGESDYVEIPYRRVGKSSTSIKCVY